MGLLGILGKIYFLVNGVGQSLRFASWYPVVSAPQTHTAMRKPRWWHSTTTHQPLRGILWAPLLQFYFGQRHVQYFVHSWPSIDVGVWGEWNAARFSIPGLLMFTFLRKHRGSNCVSLTIRASRPNPNCSHMGRCLWAVVFICRPSFSVDQPAFPIPSITLVNIDHHMPILPFNTGPFFPTDLQMRSRPKHQLNRAKSKKINWTPGQKQRDFEWQVKRNWEEACNAWALVTMSWKMNSRSNSEM